jgi:hypothetical protein
MFKLRVRTIYLVLGCISVLVGLFFTDPDGGTSTGLYLLGLSVSILAVALMHISRKALFDYPEADMQKLLAKAVEGSTGAGLALVAMAIVMAALLMLFSGKAHAGIDVKTYIPVQAQTYAPVLKQEQVKFWADHARPEILAGLVEQESCLSLTHSKCWNPKSQLKTSREEGAGFGQVTRAYNANGTVRFDALGEMSQRHKELKELTWLNVYTRPDLQLRGLVLKTKDDYSELHKVVKDPIDALQFTDSAYNGGRGGVNQDRRACAMTKGCDAQKWFNNVEKTCTKSHKAIYGDRNPCMINREHVTNVFLIRSNKYHAIMKNT